MLVFTRAVTTIGRLLRPVDAGGFGLTPSPAEHAQLQHLLRTLHHTLAALFTSYSRAFAAPASAAAPTPAPAGAGGAEPVAALRRLVARLSDATLSEAVWGDDCTHAPTLRDGLPGGVPFAAEVTTTAGDCKRTPECGDQWIALWTEVRIGPGEGRRAGEGRQAKEVGMERCAGGCAGNNGGNWKSRTQRHAMRTSSSISRKRCMQRRATLWGPKRLPEFWVTGVRLDQHPLLSSGQAPLGSEKTVGASSSLVVGSPSLRRYQHSVSSSAYPYRRPSGRPSARQRPPPATSSSSRSPRGQRPSLGHHLLRRTSATNWPRDVPSWIACAGACPSW